MFIKDWKKDIFTIPNMLSLFRLALIPLYVTIYLNAKSNADYYLAAAILAVSCLTDLIDGKIARHFNMISSLGKILDPVADKATQFTLIICLTVKYRILWYLVGLFVLKEKLFSERFLKRLAYCNYNKHYSDDRAEYSGIYRPNYSDRVSEGYS